MLGMMNALSAFQRRMDIIFTDINFVRPYLVDVIVFSSSLDEQVEPLRAVFGLIETHGLKLSISKCLFERNIVALLIHIVDYTIAAVDNFKIRTIRHATVAMARTELHRFLGLASYYCQFVKHFAEVATPFHADTGNHDIQWSTERTKAAEKMRDALTYPPVLDLPNFDQAFFLETDAAAAVLRAVIGQKKEDDSLHPV